MSVRYAARARRGITVVAFASLAFLVAGCGAEDEPKADKPAASTTGPQQSTGAKETQTEEPEEVLAVVKGQGGIELTITEAQRDPGGFLTVKGTLKNPGSEPAVLPGQVRGDETEVIKHGNSLGGATLVDSVGKKRYYVLRDTDGRPLTTTGLDILASGASAPVFMQFPAPAANVTAVTFQLPTFNPGTIKLS
ncbi:hypothetical protein ACFYV5_29820 [Streptomyces sp. NPDC003035]|uniref:hypothetical protein n=1 Tax=Streptomyces sp. NPDC003035 TaxID=3364676 RepID=UPI0036C748F9